MKKLIALAIAIVMMAALAVPAFAEITPSTNEGKGTTTVKYNPDVAYTVSIPSEITLGAKDTEVEVGGEEADAVSATGVVIATDKKLVVKVKSANGWNVKYGDGESAKTVAYKMAYGTQKTELSGTADTEILSVNSGTTTGAVELYVTRTGDATVSANFTDTLTFTVSVENVTPQA